MIYVGIDPSLTSPGLAILSEDGSPRDVFNFATKELRGGERLEAIYNWADSFFPWAHEVVTARAVIEGYAINAQNRPYDLGEVGGVFRLLLSQRNIPYTVVPPALVKKFATGNGQASKEQVQQGTERNWGLRFVQEDQCDAYVMAQLARTLHLQQPLNPAQKAVIEKIGGVQLSPARPPRNRKAQNV